MTGMEGAAVPSGRDGPTPRQNLVFFVLALVVFLATRLIGLERFPIYFFCDEAVQTVQATRLLENGFRDEFGQLLPTYFRNTESFNLSIGVYFQVLPQMLFGHSVFVARATQVLVLLTAMAAVGLMLRDFFRLRYWWVGVLVLSALPGWFLHTRIAFELMLATSCYVWFLYFYLRYRFGATRAIFPALVFGALTFYGYNTFQPVIVVTALLLLAVDAPVPLGAPKDRGLGRFRFSPCSCFPIFAISAPIPATSANASAGSSRTGRTRRSRSPGSSGPTRRATSSPSCRRTGSGSSTKATSHAT